MIKPEKIVFLGKGGIGKSTLSANLSAVYAHSGLRVLHVGCDPKGDSTALLIERPDYKPVLSIKGAELSVADPAAFVVKSRLGIDCVEAGGPEPGVGCAGRGISKMIEVFQREKVIERGNYDVVLFDVLGDVVCGGFAAPLRQGFGQKVVIVVSEEAMSLYAANNIARAVRNYAPNGVRLCGLLANVRDPKADVLPIKRFAQRIGTSVLGIIRRDPAFRKGERLSRCLTEIAPRSKPLAKLQRLARRLRKMDPRSLTIPDPMGEEEFYEASRALFAPGSARRPKRAAAREPAAQTPAPVRERRPKSPAPIDNTSRVPLEAGKAAEGAPEAPYSRWMMWTWGVEDQWREFFAEPELELHCGKPLLKDTAYVLHKELECFFVEARTDDGSASFFNYPWPEHCSVGLPLLFELRARGCRHVVVDIKDREIIFGGSRKLEQGLAPLAKNPAGTKLAVFLYSCPTVITGDDIGPVIDRFSRASGIQTVFPDRDADQPTDLLQDLFKMVGKSGGFAKAKTAKHAINLVGFPRDRALGELEALLGEAGIEINSRLLPEFDLESIRRYPAAALQVLKPHRVYEEFYERVLGKLATPAVTLESPYGIERTRRWLEEIAGRFEAGKRLKKAWVARWAGVRERWQAIRREASGRTLGFVGDAARLRKLRECRWSAGIPLLPTLRELGFKLEWLLWCPCGDAGAHTAGTDSREVIRRFHGPKELRRLLREEPLDAVYSDIFFDSRLTRAGKAQFSLAFFEPGLDGAVRTGERLLGACRLPLYKRYAPYLSDESADGT